MRVVRYQKFDFRHENLLGILRVYTPILPMMSTLALAPEIEYFGVSKYQELSFDYENSFRSHIESIFEKESIFSPGPVIANLVVIRYQQFNNEQENLSGLTIEGLHVDFGKNVNLSP